MVDSGRKRKYFCIKMSDTQQTVEVMVGDSRKVLAAFPADHVQSVITSPPY